MDINSDDEDDEEDESDGAENEIDSDDDTNENKIVLLNKSNNDTRSRKRVCVQLRCLYQIMYYRFSHGKRKTPLQVMMGESIYGKTRSKGLISNLNTVGVTVSYYEVKRHRRLLCNYTLGLNTLGEIPLPSHFSKSWCMGALDNENFADQSFISGTKVKNYTSLVSRCFSPT